MRDAEQVGWQGPGRPWRAPRGDGRIWVRVAGAWRAGDVQRWIWGADGSGWLAWASYEHPEGYPTPLWGLFRYDPATLQPRGGPARPGEPQPDPPDGA